jgi:hypothetical protein
MRVGRALADRRRRGDLSVAGAAGQQRGASRSRRGGGAGGTVTGEGARAAGGTRIDAASARASARSSAVKPWPLHAGARGGHFSAGSARL